MLSFFIIVSELFEELYMSFTIEFVSGVKLNLNDDHPSYLTIYPIPVENNINLNAIETVFEEMNFWLLAHNVNSITPNTESKPVEIKITQQTGILIWLAELMLSDKNKEKVKFDALKLQQLVLLLERLNSSDLISKRQDVITKLKNATQSKPAYTQSTETQESTSKIKIRMNRSNSFGGQDSDSFGTALHKLKLQANQVQEYSSFNGSNIDTNNASSNDVSGSFSQIITNDSLTSNDNSLDSSCATVIIKEYDDEKNNFGTTEQDENFDAVADENLAYAESEAAKLLEKHFEELWKGRVTILENDFYSISQQQNYEFKRKKTEEAIKKLLSPEQKSVFDLIKDWQSSQRNNNINISERPKAIDVLRQIEGKYQAALNSPNNAANIIAKNFYQSHAKLADYFKQMDLLTEIQAPYLNNMDVKTYFFGLIKGGKEIKIPTKEGEKVTVQPIRLAHHAIKVHEYIRQARFFEVTPQAALENIYDLLSDAMSNSDSSPSTELIKPTNRSQKTHDTYISTLMKVHNKQGFQFK